MTTTTPTPTGLGIATDEEIKAKASESVAEIAHPSLPAGSNLYGSTKIFPDYEAREGESYFTLVHGVASNQAGSFNSLRFVCSAKVCGPGGDVLATTGTKPGVAAADVDIAEALAGARRSMFHLRDRRPALYSPVHASVATLVTS